MEGVRAEDGVTDGTGRMRETVVEEVDREVAVRMDDVRGKSIVYGGGVTDERDATLPFAVSTLPSAAVSPPTTVSCTPSR